MTRARSLVLLPALLSAVLLLGACSDDGDDAAPTPAPTATTSATPSASAKPCVAFAGPPDGSARRPYLKRALAIECREDVKRLQAALGIEVNGFFDFETAAAVIERQKPFPCITANDGQVGEQTWALIVDGTQPCPARTGGPTSVTVPAWATCTSGTVAWGLLAEDGTVLRRCGSTLELVHDGTTSAGPVQEIGSSVCAEFDESFDTAAGTRTLLCVSDPRTEDILQANPTTDDAEAVWFDDVVARYVRP
ncbi:hypothetical protein GCM10009547_39610 [Sporichthya brevicatena]|uniref:Peptidoglycan binding-like domain-containing protein n=1 Tax=Sporichthya brevicatena TaxID=171442 RepID=A0ABN1H8R7_9ACTN